jgi:hypothetical protein
LYKKSLKILQFMDAILETVSILLILSLITEKIVEFLKLNFESLILRGKDELSQKIRERRIYGLSMSVGICVALACRADLFELMKEHTLTGWTLANMPTDPLTWTKVFLGSFGTGVFLSQGSSFFHDLLNTLMYIKDTRKTISKREIAINDHIENGNQEVIEAVMRTNAAPAFPVVTPTYIADKRDDSPDNNR